MVFERRPSFFLDLGSEGAQPAKVAIAEIQPATAEAEDQTNAAVPLQQAASSPTAKPAAAPEASGQPLLTTAEAIAAELRAAQDAMPAPSNATFAPECLNPANAVPTRRRKAGANLAGFKSMAAGMFRN
jgi:hypothetical protein